jgi:energy-coupling factor transporter transmembrane protein EcfT
VKVFDVLDAGYTAWWFPAFGLIFVVIGLCILIGPAVLRALGIPFRENRRWSGRLTGYFFVIFATFWTGVAFYTSYSQYQQNRMMVEQNRCWIVEGPVEHFVPMPYGGHASESVSVHGVPFKYSDFMITGGFNNTASHGGPLTPDSYVRICYDPSNNVILRLEIRGFNGTTKRAGAGLFPPSPPPHGRGSDVNETFTPQWFGWLIGAGVLLDLLGLIALYRPYLRTFLRIGSKADRFMLRPELEPEKTIKLSHCLIYWDRPDHAIWLRPRGLVLLQIPMMVARIHVDADDRSVLGWEVRFSSGGVGVFVLGAAAACWSVVATALPHGGLPPGILAGLAAFTIVVIGLNLRTLRSRMMDLVNEALPELAA